MDGASKYFAQNMNDPSLQNGISPCMLSVIQQPYSGLGELAATMDEMNHVGRDLRGGGLGSRDYFAGADLGQPSKKKEEQMKDGSCNIPPLGSATSSSSCSMSPFP